MQLLTASLDELVFEGRNKAYGAYQLRQEYGSHLASAGGITLGIASALLLGILLWPAAQSVSKPVSKPLTPIDLTPPPPPAVIEKPKLATLTPPAAAPARPKAPTAPAPPQPPTSVAKDELVPTPPKPIAAVVPATQDLPAGPATTSTTDPLALPGSSDGGGTKAADAASTSSQPFIAVEKMPEFAGGQAALLRYLSSHLRYPAQALREQAEGRVFLSFVVRADGTIADVTVLKGLGFGLDEEAQRVVRQMPAWTPGYQAQHAVAVRFTLPITFKIQ